MAAEEVEEEIINIGSDSEQLELADLERILSIPLDILTALEASEDFSIVTGALIEYVTSKQNEMKECEEVIQEYTESIEQKDRDYESKIEELDLTVAELNTALHSKSELEEQLNELQVELEQHKEIIAESNQLVTESHNELESLYTNIEQHQQTISNLQEEITILQTKSHDLQLTNEELQEELAAAQTKIEELKPPPDIPGADRDELLRLLDRRQHEVTQLANSWNELTNKLEITSSEKQTIQLKLDDLMAQESSIRLKEQLLAKEKSLIQQQNDWLIKDLELKNNQVLELKKERAAIMSEKEIQLSSKDQELEHVKSSLVSKTTLVQELQGRLDSAHSRLMEVREEQANVEDQLRRELASQSKLASLYQSASTDGEKLAMELMTKLESLQSSLDEMSSAKSVALQQINELEEQSQTYKEESTLRIEQLERELSNANDLLMTARRQGTLPLTQGEVLSISPAASATSAHLLSGLTLTQIYTRYVESVDELTSVKDENTRLNNYLTQIMEELDEKTPALQKLRRDHDMLLQKCQTQQDQLSSIVEECESMRLESEEALKNSRSIERENKRLKTLTCDLGRQVKCLLKECEEARGGVASTSHDWSRDVSSDDITSSSQVIDEHLVIFRNIEELQEQNQKLLAVIRELSETKEKEETEMETQATADLKQSLDDAVRELNILKESRERQKEMVQSIVQQRDMYKILLAQNTPLPEETTINTSQLSTSQDSILSSPRKTTPTNLALQELKEQFEAYRREKATNDSILQEQITQYRDEASTARLDSAKLASKLEYANERYQMLESSFKDLKSEAAALRNKDKITTNTLTKSQTTVDNLTKELLTSRENLSHLNIKVRSLQAERDLLNESEKRTRQQYEDILKEQTAQTLLLSNLQTIQNNLERNEFETKTKLSTRIEALEKEAGLLKEKLHNEEDKRERIKEAYETQVQDLAQKLLSSQTHENELTQSLSASEERVNNTESELNTTKVTLEEVKGQLEETRDRLRAMEEDAGAEFRAKIRLLERKVSDGTAKITSLEEQLKTSQGHCEQYKSISEANEKALQEINETSQQFQTQLNEQIQSLKNNETELLETVKLLKEEKQTIETELEEKLQQIQEQLTEAMSEKTSLEERTLEAERIMEEAKSDQLAAREDAKRCSESAKEHQELYQRELVQHGHTMEQLNTFREKENERETELMTAREEISKLKEELELLQTTQNEKESHLIEEKRTADERCEHLTKQNNLLHSEASTLTARILTLTEQLNEGGVITRLAPPTTILQQQDEEGAELTTPTSSDQLWEVIRFVRREKDIAETKRDLAESQVAQLKQNVSHLTHQLDETKGQLQKLADTTKAHENISLQYEEIMSKVQTLNVLTDSNKLLRDEKETLQKQLSTLQVSHEELLIKVQTLKEAQQSLTGQKDALLAEKAALRKEVERWNNRTNQLIEQYNKIDPEEYKQLVQEKDLRKVEMTQLSSKLNTLSQEKTTLEEEFKKVQKSLEEFSKKGEEQEAELNKLQAETKTQKEEILEKNKMITKIKEVGRKYRSMTDEFKKKFEESETIRKQLETQLEEAKNIPPESTEHQTILADLQSQLDSAKQELEATKVSLETANSDKNDKFQRIVQTARHLKKRNEALKNEKDNLEKELEETKNLREQKTSELETQETNNSNLQSQLDTLQTRYDNDTKKLEQRIEKLEQDLRNTKVVTTRRRVVQPTVVVPCSESPSTTVVSVQPAPTAAVKPTVTTTPTASIRPMPLHTTSAPTAHVTPTQVTTSISATSEATPTQSTVGSATVFVRSTSPHAITQTTSSQATPTSSGVGEGPPPTSRPIDRPIKRPRDATESSSTSAAVTDVSFPPVKRSKQQVISEAEPSTTTDHTHPSLDVQTDTSPDTQSDQETTPPSDIGSGIGEVTMATAEGSRRAESEELPSSRVVADTTSDVPTSQTTPTNNEIQQNNEEPPDDTQSAVTMETDDAGVAEPTVAMDTESSNDVIIINYEERDDNVQGEVTEGETLQEEEEEEIEEQQQEQSQRDEEETESDDVVIIEETEEEREEEGDGEGEEVEEGEIEEEEEEEEEDGEERGEDMEDYVTQPSEDFSEDDSQLNTVQSESLPPVLVVTDEQSLPDDEIAIEITAPSASSTTEASLQQTAAPLTSFTTTTAGHHVVSSELIPPPATGNRRLGLLVLRERASTPGGSELNVVLPVSEDHQVPCTPVLAEDKQLGKAPQPQSVPADLGTAAPSSSSTVPPPTTTDQQLDSNNDTEEATSSQGEVVSYEETQFGELSSTTCPPSSLAPPTSFTASGSAADILHERSPVADLGDDGEGGEKGQTLSGDIGDDIIDAIIASSSDEDDMEEGELTTTTTTQEGSSQPSSSSGAAAPSSLTQQDDSSKKDARKIEPIVWDKPSTSGQTTGVPQLRPAKVSKPANIPPQRRTLRTGRGRGRGRGSGAKKF